MPARRGAPAVTGRHRGSLVLCLGLELGLPVVLEGDTGIIDGPPLIESVKSDDPIHSTSLPRSLPAPQPPALDRPAAPPDAGGGGGAAPRAYKVTIEHGGGSRVVEVDEDETILSRALDEGLDVPHDCKLGVCMTCPARLVSGEVDQSDGMLSDDVVAQGYALLCAAYPRSDCTIRVIPEDELLQVQLATADD
ncbi:ferredoxin C 1, chloroplastic-like [Phragmites australis]|uniref:ferredoxin C 1, chloroplastic-like n=1 Tax=Phragmites australis TaxID=29695 RepID=UPI002D79C7A5|nr:ferredoxin C 1, chloroplastic-like [Phragmites australis]